MAQTTEQKRRSAKQRRLWQLFRLTLEEWEKVLAFQMQHPTYALLLEKHLGTEHRHSDGKVRGILGWRLNRAYGMIEKAFPDNTAEVLRALALFHERHPAEIALGKKTYGLIGKAQVKKIMKYGPPKKVGTK